MAFSSYEIKLLKGGRRIHGIENVKFAEHLEYEPKNQTGKPLSGRILRRGRPFSINTQLPGVDFKILRAMLATGEKGAVNEVLTKKRRSIVDAEYVWDGIRAFSHQVAPRITDQHYEAVLQELREQLVLDEKVKPLPFEEAAEGIPQNTNPGFPFIEIAPGKKKGEIIREYMTELKSEWEVENIAHMVIPDCAAFARSNISGPEKNKVRPVWAYPITAIIAEAMFALPVGQLMKMQKMFRNSAFGLEMMCGGMEFVNNMARKAKTIDPGCKYLMTDYSSFDATVPAWLIRDCFAILFEKFDISENPRYYVAAYKKIVSYFINTPIRNADGRRFLKDHGIPSGTMFTNIMGTICNFVVTRYLIRVTTHQSPIFDIYFGDDALVCLPEKAIINMENLSYQAKKAFCMNLSADKSYWTHVTTNIHFLGCYNAMGSPYKPELDIFAAMVYPQSTTDDWAFALSRSLGCVSAAGGQSPAVLNTARHVMLRASNVAGKIEQAERLVVENPRMARFFENMGLDPKKIGTDLLSAPWKTIPSSSCNKLRYGIDICVKPHFVNQ